MFDVVYIIVIILTMVIYQIAWDRRIICVIMVVFGDCADVFWLLYVDFKDNLIILLNHFEYKVAIHILDFVTINPF